MHLIKSNKIKLLLCSLIFTNTFAKDFYDEILSQSRKESFKLDKQQLKEETSKLKKDWINPITYQFRKNYGEDYKTEKSIISINQAIFKSGGIYQAIKYANSNDKYTSLEIQQQEKALIKNALNYLFLIKKTNLNIKKTTLLVKNAQLDVKRKKEQVLNGFLDSSFLDNALLTLNETKHKLIDLKYQKKDLINKFENISSKDYKTFELPKFQIFTQKEFLENNLFLKKAEADIQRKGNFSHMTISKYLPSVNVFYNFSKNHFSDGNKFLSKNSKQDFGLSINVPFDTRTFNDIQSKKIEYLKSKLNLKNLKDDESTFFKNAVNQISMIDDRIKITKEDLKLYDSILKTMREEQEAQLKTKSDVETLENSQNIKNIDLTIYEIDKQVELLNLYAKLNK